MRARGNAVTHGVTARACLPEDVLSLIEAFAADIAAGDPDPVVVNYAWEIARLRIAAHRAGAALDAATAALLPPDLDKEEGSLPASLDDPTEIFAREVSSRLLAARQKGLPIRDDLVHDLQDIIEGTIGPPAVPEPRGTLSRDAMAEMRRLTRYRRRALGEARTLERRLAAYRCSRKKSRKVQNERPRRAPRRGASGDALGLSTKVSLERQPLMTMREMGLRRTP